MLLNTYPCDIFVSSHQSQIKEDIIFIYFSQCTKIIDLYSLVLIIVLELFSNIVLVLVILLEIFIQFSLRTRR